MLGDIGRMLLLLQESLSSLPAAWRQRAKVFDQLFEIGNASLFMACLLSLFIGGVLALQTGAAFARRQRLSPLCLAPALCAVVAWSAARW